MNGSRHNLGSRTFVELVEVLDRMSLEVRMGVLDASETWRKGGPVAMLEYEAGRAALMAYVLGNSIAENPLGAGDKMQQNYFRYVRQLESFARLQIDIEQARLKGALPASDGRPGPAGMVYADTEDDEPNPHEPSKGVTKDGDDHA